jgi:Cdc6-like AAA superfamily ATPase
MVPFLKEFTTGYDLGVRDLARCQSFVGELEKVPDSPRSRRRGEELDQVQRAFFERFSSLSPETCAFHQEAYPLAEAVAPWESKLYGKIKSIPCDHPVSKFGPIINWKHIVQPDRKRGFHFCPEGDPLQAKIEHKIVHPITGVYCGRFEGKFSTFFPAQDQEHLFSMLSSAKSLYTKDNRALMETVGPSGPFQFEACFKKEGLCLSTAYPIFFFGTPETGKTFLLNQGMDPEQVDFSLSHLDTVYEDPSSFVVEAAKRTGLPVERGFYLLIKK